MIEPPTFRERWRSGQFLRDLKETLWGIMMLVAIVIYAIGIAAIIAILSGF